MLFIVNPTFFEASNLKQFIEAIGSQLFFIYTVISLIRGFFLIPSTPFVLLGVLLFPNNLNFVFCISMLGIIVASTSLYYFSDLLGFSDKLRKKFPDKMDVWKRRLNSPWSTFIVLIWSFFPLVPTDLICYVAGIVKMPFRYLLAGVVIGEAILVYLYVYMGSSLVSIF